MHVPGGHSKYAKECSRVKNKVQDFVECIDKEFIQLNSVTFGALKIDHIYIYIYIFSDGLLNSMRFQTVICP